MNTTEIQNLLSESTKKTLEPNTLIFKEGEKDNNFYFILKGDVAIGKQISNGQTKVIAELESGEFLGEGILSGKSIKPATATTITTTDLLILTYDQFKKLCKSKPEKIIDFLLMVMESTNERLTNTNTKLLSVYEINQLLGTYQNDPKKLAEAVTEKLKDFTNSDEGFFFIKNEFSDDYRLIYTNSTNTLSADLNPKDFMQTHKSSNNESIQLYLNLGNSGVIVLIKKTSNKDFDDDQIKMLVLIGEQIGMSLKQSTEKAAEKAKKILERKHFEL